MHHFGRLKFLFFNSLTHAGVAELVDALGLGPSGISRGGSSPLSGTPNKVLHFKNRRSISAVFEMLVIHKLLRSFNIFALVFIGCNSYLVHLVVKEFQEIP